MMRTRRWLVVAVALVASCKKPGGSTDQAAPGPGTAAGKPPSAAGAPSAPAAAPPTAAAPVAAAPVDPAALDKALADKHIAPDAVIKRASSPSSAWALIATRDKDKQLRAYDLLRIRAGDAAMLHLVPPAGNDARFDDITASLDVRDLDGDGNDDALLVVEWRRQAKVKDACPGCFRTQDEDADQLYVVSGDGGELKTAFTHLVAYSSQSEGHPEGNDRPTAEPDDVAYDWKVAGSPPVLKLMRSKGKTAAQNRLAGALDPVADPLLSAGAGKDVPLVLK